MFRYYFKENKWEKVRIYNVIKLNQVEVIGENLPNPRAGHSAVLFGDSMVVFGGKDDENNKLNDLWEFDFKTF